MPKIIIFSKLVLNCLFFGGYFEWVRPIPKDAYRLPPSPKEGYSMVGLSLTMNSFLEKNMDPRNV